MNSKRLKCDNRSMKHSSSNKIKREQYQHSEPMKVNIDETRTIVENSSSLMSNQEKGECYVKCPNPIYLKPFHPNKIKEVGTMYSYTHFR